MKTIQTVTKALTAVALASAGVACTAESGQDVATTQQALICEVPVMTSNTTPSGTVTSSGDYSIFYPARYAFDGNSGTMWISAVNQTPAWIGYEFADSPVTVTSYAINFINGSLATRAPKEFTLQGFDGTSWVVVDERTNETGWAGAERREYSVTSPGSYSSYRLHVTDDNDDREGVVVVSMSRLELVGTCDVDSDGDGLLDTVDACPNSTELPVDETGCSVADLVPCDGSYGSKGQYVAAVVEVANDFYARGIITQEQRKELVQAAAKSDCGG